MGDRLLQTDQEQVGVENLLRQFASVQEQTHPGFIHPTHPKHISHQPFSKGFAPTADPQQSPNMMIIISVIAKPYFTIIDNQTKNTKGTKP
ncbi:hypothetical protein KCP74_13930 [Salmonella enterica subsp. enterica]|nr:hypothetical protein KCP74_13930 [Salmonella enterica subsp. enterica]